jgi:hypothetical protein
VLKYFQLINLKHISTFRASPKVIPGFPFEYFFADKSFLSDEITPSLSNNDVVRVDT